MKDKVLKYIEKAKGPITVREITDQLGINPITAKRILLELSSEGKIKSHCCLDKRRTWLFWKGKI